MSVGITIFGQAMAEGQSNTLTIPACRGIVTAGFHPTSAYGVPVVGTTFASAPAVASGVARYGAGHPELSGRWTG